MEEYIKKLQSAADKLTTENRILRKHHSTICDKVIYSTSLCCVIFRSVYDSFSSACPKNATSEASLKDILTPYLKFENLKIESIMRSNVKNRGKVWQKHVKTDDILMM